MIRWLKLKFPFWKAQRRLWVKPCEVVGFRYWLFQAWNEYDYLTLFNDVDTHGLRILGQEFEFRG